MNSVGKGVIKKDAMALVTGQPVYCDDLAPKDCLIIKLLRSPHAYAKIRSIDTSIAKRIPGIEAVYTYEDVPTSRFTLAGQSYPEPSPYDRRILENVVRYVGDEVAIVAGTNEDCVDRALKAIKVDYEVLEPLLNFEKSIDNAIVVHEEDDYKCLCEIGNDVKRNIVSSGESVVGDVDAVLKDCEVVLERDYHTKANAQAMMETMRSYCYIDTYGRLNCVSSTQIPFHVRRILSNALEIPKSKINVVKPRIGGGFGAKQTACCEIFTAFVTWKLKKPTKIVYTREETFAASNSRHEMKMHVRIGATKDGTIEAIDLYTLSNQGAYGEHGPTTIGLAGHKSLPLYNHVKASRFTYDVVYTNTMRAGAYRGYGATQGQFAVESIINELADELNMDPCEIRFKNMTRENEVLSQYYNEELNACALDRCLEKAMEMIDYKNKPLRRDMGDFVRGLGVSLSMQGSGISGLDVGSVEIKLQDDGFYTLSIGATDMGTGCDTILAQMVAECMDCDVDQVVTSSLDTDHAPYDTGSYASSTTYVTGKAVEKCALELRDRIEKLGAKMLGCEKCDVTFDGKKVICESGENKDKCVTLADISTASMCGNDIALSVTNTHTSPISPPPFMVGAAEVEVDLLTGESRVVEYDACVDCGTPVNPNLARVQAEGGILQGIGMTMSENITYSDKGKLYENSFLQYKIPSRMDIGHINVEFESSYENAGPFGAKSIGEVVINTPLPAITDALSHAAGKRFYELPITPGQIAMARQK